ncbi:diguanylate cyclase (GGDEF) domain-containing protein [Ensifer adhaerens]|nr:diguanylate cyclase (GGDEF) domain-containing protein [Ensifer adhaerens]
MTTATFLLAVMLALGLIACAAAFRSPRAPGKNAFILAVVGALWWTAMVLLRFATPDLPGKVFYSELAWFGIVGAPMFWAAGILSYSGYRKLGTPTAIAAIAVYVALAGVAALTNDWHHAIYTGIVNAERPSFSHGWLFHILMTVTYIFMIWACITAMSRLQLSQSLHRRQLFGLVAAMLMPWIANFAFVFFEFRLFNDDPTPFAFSLTSLAMLMMQEHGKLFVAPPIARDVIFNVLPDPIIVIDGDARVLEVNPAAGKLPGLGDGAVGTILANDHPLRAWLGRDTSDPHQLFIIHQIETTYEVSVQRLEKWGRDGSVMFVLRDVTAREAAQQQLAAASRDLVVRLNENLVLQTKLAEEASRDHLTGLYNRRHASRIMPDRIEAHGVEQAIAFALIDLDYFKQVNDQFGHDIGDNVLIAFGRILQDNMPPGGCAFRFGGEEFLVAMPGKDAVAALALTRHWRSLLAEEAPTLTPGFQLTFSCGIAVSPKDGQTLGACTKAADMALYDAKLRGRNCDVVWQDSPNPLDMAS